MTKVVTIGGGNGQSNLLDALYQYGSKDFEVSSIVSMSDDGRTTGRLMACFDQQLGMHLPPPGDLRRCLFMMSSLENREEIQELLETVIESSERIGDLSITDYFHLLGRDVASLLTFPDHIMDMKLPLQTPVSGYKLGNLIMANLYYNLGDYNKMLDIMHDVLAVSARIIPVTTSKAYIRAVLGNGDIVESQDHISNVAAYASGIADLELMEDSKHAYQHKDVFKALKKADYIVISPGDLFTSTISNFVIGGVKEVIQSTHAKIIYVGNNTNKGGETSGLTYLDFVNKIERFLGKRIDIFICNNTRLELSETQRQQFQNDKSVKGGDFLFLSSGEKAELKRRKIRYFEADLLDRVALYKHDKSSIATLLNHIIV